MTLRRDRWKRTQLAYKQVSSGHVRTGDGPEPDGVIAKTSRRVAVALTMSIGLGLLMRHGWSSSQSALFFRTSILDLSASFILMAMNRPTGRIGTTARKRSMSSRSLDQLPLPAVMQAAPWLFVPVIAPLVLIVFWLIRVRLMPRFESPGFQRRKAVPQPSQWRPEP